jgi:hypothetical protein
MSLEQDLGTLIRMLNPYGGGGPATMHFAPVAPPTAATLLGAVAPPVGDLGQFQMEVDNYEGEWSFKGQTHRVTRAVRIPYRYPLRDASGNFTGLYATENLLIGYAGGNGS